VTTSQLKKVQPSAPTLTSATAVAGGGSMPATQQFYVITALVGSGGGESAVSTERNATPAAGGHIDLVIGASPAGTTGIRIYRGTATGAQNVLVAQIAGAFSGTFTDTFYAGVAGTPPATAAWGNVTKSGANPTKANVPAGTPAGLGQALVEAMAMWTCVGTATTAGTSNQARIGDKVAAGAGFDLQEV